MNIISLKHQRSYRLQTLGPIIETNSIMVFNDEFFSIIKCIIFGVVNLNKKINLIFCDGEINTINSKILLFFCKIKRENILWFNSSLESSKSKNYYNYTFFPEQISKFKIKNANAIIPFPNVILNINSQFKFPILYISEVYAKIERSSYPNLSELTKFKLSKLKKIASRLDGEKFSILSDINYSINLFYSLKLPESKKQIYLPEIYCFLKSSIRLACIQKLKKKFGDDLILVGKTWENFGFSTLYSDYNYDRNNLMYTQTKIPIDFGSTAGEFPMYFRSYEILKHANIIFQSHTKFGSKIFGKLNKVISFDNTDEMMYKIMYLIKLPSVELNNLKKKIINNLKINKKRFNNYKL